MGFRLGGLWNYATSEALALTGTTSDTAVQFNGWEHSSGVGGPGIEANSDFGWVKPKVSGWHVGYCSLSFIGETGVTYFFEMRVNGSLGSGFRGSVTGTDAEVDNVMFMGGANLNEGDEVTLYVYADSAANFTLVDGQFGLFGW